MFRPLTIVALTFLSSVSLTSRAEEAAPPALTPPPGMKREIISRTDVPNSNYEVVVIAMTVPPNVTVGRHSHPGFVSGYVAEGEYTMIADGQPPRLLKAGEHLALNAGVIHDERTGDSPAKIVVVFTVEKGKPLTTPVK